MTGGRDPQGLRRSLRIKELEQRQRPAPPPPTWIESVRRRIEAEEAEGLDQPPQVKQRINELQQTKRPAPPPPTWIESVRRRIEAEEAEGLDQPPQVKQRIKEMQQTKRPAPPAPAWVESVRRRREAEEAEVLDQPPLVKRRTEPVVPTPPVVPAPPVANPPVVPSETPSGQSGGMVIPPDVLEEVVKGVKGYGLPAPIHREEEEVQQEVDDSQLPPLADFLYRFIWGFAVIRNYVERGLCGMQALIDSLQCQRILPDGVYLPSMNDLLQIYRQNVSRGTYDVSFEVHPEDRNMPGPFQAEILSHIISEWSRIYSSPPFLPHEETEESRLQRRVPPLIAGFHSDGEMPFTIGNTQPGTRIVWIHNSGDHWEGLMPSRDQAAINQMFRDYGHELYRSETCPQWFVDICQRRQRRQPVVGLFPDYDPFMPVHAEGPPGLFGRSPSVSPLSLTGPTSAPAPPRTLQRTAAEALERLERLFQARRRRDDDMASGRHQDSYY
ncbi:hypothetical protein F5Y00DRAFT_262363 [Daldinia vernicosa]|uniref:uncharacterized protein n=1 Tax=Daldinia vernicosa TaxID=114800 RepID=UPI002008141D|nr:uncharacterized protein F5Y00DRAFT_262363 [Daldinia vernicosa]KAI0848576.1 hypothetical protein F5Y00DRAFT_262363 [Daldinia vernicosa]